MTAKGKVFKYGANVDTDVIIPARYLNTSNPAELAKHCMEDIDSSFVSRVQPGDIIVGGPNFGCGSSREHAPVAIKASGISCVIAPSFARIFYRNAINMGLAIMESAEASERIGDGDVIEVNFETGEIRDETTGETFTAKPFPDFIRKIIESDGLVGYISGEKPDCK
jgi:3-isopropylmalate/(R)-2-methylmalate dehydratase small subunit